MQDGRSQPLAHAVDGLGGTAAGPGAIAGTRAAITGPDEDASASAARPAPTWAAVYWGALRRTPVAVWDENLTDWAAALTYYTVLALFPVLLVVLLAPGGALAVGLWLAPSAGFALYASQTATYRRLYGSLAGLVVFLVWLWICNLVLLIGAKFNAELTRPTTRSGPSPEPGTRDCECQPDNDAETNATGPGCTVAHGS